MSDDDKIVGFDDFLMNAQEIRSSADSVVASGIDYNVQCNVARCLLSINENKAIGEAFVKIGLSETIQKEWGDDFVYGVQKKIFGEKAIQSQPELFVDAYRKPHVFLDILAKIIDEIVERGFVCSVRNEFGLNVEKWSKKEVALHFPNKTATKEILEHTFFTLEADIVSAIQSSSSSEDEQKNLFEEIWGPSSGNILPPDWPLIFSPSLGLIINW